ncbi:hypothetical protein RKD19_005843 [Streptomyces canus]
MDRLRRHVCELRMCAAAVHGPVRIPRSHARSTPTRPMDGRRAPPSGEADGTPPPKCEALVESA